jgi:hypothetical protein
MNAATASRPTATFATFLAGLQAGMIAVCWMLAWLGVSAMWQRRSFWTAENLMASMFHGEGAIRRGFGASTLSGMAVYFILYSLLGAGFALAVRDRLTGLGTLLAAVVFALSWHYLWFHAIGKTVMPLVALLHIERSTVFAHVIFGALAARFPAYLPGAPLPPEPEDPLEPEAPPLA